MIFVFDKNTQSAPINFLNLDNDEVLDNNEVKKTAIKFYFIIKYNFNYKIIIKYIAFVL